MEGSNAAPIITVYSPLNETYTGSVLLNFTISRAQDWWQSIQKVSSVSYCIDKKSYNLITVNSNLSIPLNYSTLLNTTDGTHVLEIYVNSIGSVRNLITGDVSETTNISKFVEFFTVDNTGPHVEIISIENITYSARDVELIFACNESVSKTSYVLDDKEIVITGNSTLTGLTGGSHSIKVFAWDTYGNIGESQTIYFTVNGSQIASESFPLILLIVVLLLSFSVFTVYRIIKKKLLRRIG